MDWRAANSVSAQAARQTTLLAVGQKPKLKFSHLGWLFVMLCRVADAAAVGGRTPRRQADGCHAIWAARDPRTEDTLTLQARRAAGSADKQRERQTLTAHAVCLPSHCPTAMQAEAEAACHGHSPVCRCDCTTARSAFRAVRISDCNGTRTIAHQRTLFPCRPCPCWLLIANLAVTA